MKNYIISYDKEDNLEAVRQTIAKYGIPQEIYLDNVNEFSKDTKSDEH